ncbi:MAG: hypothetical protein MRY83_09810, partial [Flavobacteriales bacterium]|nr:hypothetical protein [Flavobacteriales bacterium]
MKITTTLFVLTLIFANLATDAQTHATFLKNKNDQKQIKLYLTGNLVQIRTKKNRTVYGLIDYIDANELKISTWPRPRKMFQGSEKRKKFKTIRANRDIANYQKDSMVNKLIFDSVVVLSMEDVKSIHVSGYYENIGNDALASQIRISRA